VARRRWDRVREFALSLPAATEDFPWGERLVKIKRKEGVPSWRKDGVGVLGPTFVWLGADAISVRLEASYEAAIALAGASPTTHSGLGQWGWLTVPLDSADADLLCDWVEESYRAVAPKRFIAQLKQEDP
jgi:predicted DNA-binding protein (MmcQ/YjbR family)